MCGFSRRTSLYSSSTLMWRWLLRNAWTIVSRWAVDLSRWARRCSLKRAKRSSAVRFVFTIGYRFPDGDPFQQLTRGGRQVDVAQLAAGELVDQHVDLHVGRQAAFQKEDLVGAQSAAAAAHAVPHFTQQSLL